MPTKDLPFYLGRSRANARDKAWDTNDDVKKIIQLIQ